jgi:hypothetical protein
VRCLNSAFRLDSRDHRSLQSPHSPFQLDDVGDDDGERGELRTADVARDGSDMPITGFRCRAAIQWTVEQSAQRHANKTGEPVRVYAVMGGYEARTAGRGAPRGSHTLLKTITNQTSDDKPKAERSALSRGVPAGRAKKSQDPQEDAGKAPESASESDEGSGVEGQARG